jgi:hypothetical protein
MALGDALTTSVAVKIPVRLSYVLKRSQMSHIKHGASFESLSKLCVYILVTMVRLLQSFIINSSMSTPSDGDGYESLYVVRRKYCCVNIYKPV